MTRAESLSGSTLRLSVTDRCNLRCRYCMPSGGVAFVPHSELPTLEELRETVAWLAGNLGVNRVKITGGEPLVRRGLPSLIRGLCRIPQVLEVSMTTNATLLEPWAPILRNSGLRRVNVSLDSLDPVRFRQITRGGSVEAALRGIRAAVKTGFSPIKINSVLRRSSWKEDVPALLDFAAQTGFEVRFIELMRTGTEEAWTTGEYVSAASVRSFLGVDTHELMDMAEQVAPARIGRVTWKGKTLRVGWITPVSHAFCSACNRLRLDARGRIRRCLMDPAPLALVDALRRDAPGEVERTLRVYLAGKRRPSNMVTAATMNSIGG